MNQIRPLLALALIAGAMPSAGLAAITAQKVEWISSDKLAVTSPSQSSR